MIYTITFNPSIDYFIEVYGPLLDTEVNRADHERLKGGGKGLNVSMTLNELKIASTAIALLGGFTGSYIEEYLKDKEYINLHAIPVEGANRINVKIHNEAKTLCINGNGPLAKPETKESLLDVIKKVNCDDWIVISGSSIQNIDNDFISQIAQLVHERNAKLVMDMERLDLHQLQILKPYLIKPNRYEFSLLVGNEANVDPLVKIQKVLDCGVENILLSLGCDGAIFANQQKLLYLQHDAIHALNKVGSGDAMLAAFIGKLSQGCPVKEALIWSGACGNAAASTFEDVSYTKIVAFIDHMVVEKIDRENSSKINLMLNIRKV